MQRLLTRISNKNLIPTEYTESNSGGHPEENKSDTISRQDFPLFGIV